MRILSGVLHAVCVVILVLNTVVAYIFNKKSLFLADLVCVLLAHVALHVQCHPKNEYLDMKFAVLGLALFYVTWHFDYMISDELWLIQHFKTLAIERHRPFHQVYELQRPAEALFYRAWSALFLVSALFGVDGPAKSAHPGGRRSNVQDFETNDPTHPDYKKPKQD
jgi:hypothetical protein